MPKKTKRARLGSSTRTLGAPDTVRAPPKASFSDLPVEVVQMILSEYIISRATTYYEFYPRNPWQYALKALNLRTVNRIFDQMVQYLLFATDIVGPLPCADPCMPHTQRTTVLLKRVKSTTGKTHDARLAAILEACQTFCKLTAKDPQDPVLDSFLAEIDLFGAQQVLCEAVMKQHDHSFRFEVKNRPHSVMVRENLLLAAVGTNNCVVLRKSLQDDLDWDTLQRVVHLVGGCRHFHTVEILLDFTLDKFPEESEMTHVDDVWPYRLCVFAKAFLEAVREGYVHTVRAHLLTESVHFALDAEAFKKAASQCIALGKKTILEDLITFTKSGSRSRIFRSALDMACKEGQLVLLETLLRRVQFDQCALQEAAVCSVANCSMKTLEKLERHGLNLEEQCWCNGRTSPLTAAVSKGNMDIVKYMFKKGATTESLRNGALHSLVELVSSSSMSFRDFKKIIRLLLDNGGLNFNDVRGNYTLLARAALNGQTKLVKFFLEHDADPHRQRNGVTPLLAAVSSGIESECEPLIKIFLDLDLNIEGLSPSTSSLWNKRGIKGMTRPVALAAKLNRPGVVKFLVKKGAKPMEEEKTEEKKVEADA